MGKMSSPGFQRKIRDNAKKFEFQAEVGLGDNSSYRTAITDASNPG
jgi:hypothetical protein